jgi:hypothetical protein
MCDDRLLWAHDFKAPWKMFAFRANLDETEKEQGRVYAGNGAGPWVAGDGVGRD